MKKYVIAVALSLILFCTPNMTMMYAYGENVDAAQIVEKDSQSTITGFQDIDINERCFYISKSDKPSLQELLTKMPSTLKIYLDGSTEATSIDVTYECVGEEYETSESYYFQFSPVWDEDRYELSDNLDRLSDAPYISVFFYDGSGASTFSVTGSTNEATVYRFLVNNMGLNSAGACGVMANIQHESGFNPNATGDSGTSYGICQWHNSRWTSLQNWCNSNGYNWKTLTGQLNYLKFELSKNDWRYLYNGKTIYNYISSVANTAQGAYEAGYYWCYYFEVPANKATVSVTRGNLAKNSYWKEYGKPAVPKPGNITGLKIGGRATDALRLNWNKNDSAEGYIVEQNKNGKWTRIARIGNNSTVTWRISGLSASTIYQFRVQAFNFSGSTPQYSGYQYINGTTLPTAVTGVKIGGRATDALRLNWNKNSKASGYIIEQNKSGKWTRIARIGNNSTVTYRIAGLQASTKYQFRIQAFGFDGSTPLYSGWQYINGTTLPTAVTGLKIGGTARDALRLNWNKNSKASGYIIEQNKNGKWTRIARIGNNSTLTFRVEKLQASTTYQFRVQAFGFDGSTPLYSSWQYINGKTNK